MKRLQQSLLFKEQPKPVNVATVPKRSPFRYPGGKTWFVPRLRDWLNSKPTKPDVIIEPFAGGGIVTLTAIFENLAHFAKMAEIDGNVASVWKVILEGDADWLADKIENFSLSVESASVVLKAEARNDRSRAFQTIVKNRICHGGILAPGSGFLKYGESGKGILSRWYPRTLARRIREIAEVSDKIEFRQQDAFELILEHKDSENAVFFIDPPYTAGGKKAGSRLYTHFDVDHEELFSICSQVRGDVVMTYDNAEEVKSLALRFGYSYRPIPMKGTQHAEMTELVVGKDLSWMD